MGILNKILTAFRGGANEVGQSIVDANSTRIFEQEIRDAEKHLTKAKRELTDVMAKEMQASREIDRIKRAVAEHEAMPLRHWKKAMKLWHWKWPRRLPSWKWNWPSNKQPMTASAPMLPA